MDDKGNEILKRAFGEDPPLTEEQKQIRRNAAAFAIISFHQTLGDEQLRKMRVTLTPNEISLAKSFADNFPGVIQTLPASELNSAQRGFGEIIVIIEIMTALLEDEDRKITGKYEIAQQLFKQDPSGLSFAQYLLNQAEDRATQNRNIDLEGKGDEFRAKEAAIMGAAKDVPDEQDPDFYNQQIEDVSLGKNPFVILDSSQTKRKAFIAKNKERLREEIPMEKDAEGKLVPSDKLKLAGARLAFGHYKTAVEEYYRWRGGDKTIPV